MNETYDPNNELQSLRITARNAEDAAGAMETRMRDALESAERFKSARDAAEQITANVTREAANLRTKLAVMKASVTELVAVFGDSDDPVAIEAIERARASL